MNDHTFVMGRIFFYAYSICKTNPLKKSHINASEDEIEASVEEVCHCEEGVARREVSSRQAHEGVHGESGHIQAVSGVKAIVKEVLKSNVNSAPRSEGSQKAFLEIVTTDFRPGREATNGHRTTAKFIA